MVAAGADPFATTSSKMTPLHAACEGGREEFVNFLLQVVEDKKIDLFNRLDADGKKPFDLAIAVSPLTISDTFVDFQTHSLFLHYQGKHSAVVQRLRVHGDPNTSSAACAVS